MADGHIRHVLDRISLMDKFSPCGNAVTLHAQLLYLLVKVGDMSVKHGFEASKFSLCHQHFNVAQLKATILIIPQNIYLQKRRTVIVAIAAVLIHIAGLNYTYFVPVPQSGQRHAAQ